MDNFELQSLRNVVKEGVPDIVMHFEKKIKEIKIKGKRKSNFSSMYTEKLLSNNYPEAENREVESL